MGEAAVTDSTCLIALEQIGQLDLLPALFDPIHAPPAVERECGGVPKWLTVTAPADTALVTALKMTIDDGEAETIALASNSATPATMQAGRLRSQLLAISDGGGRLKLSDSGHHAGETPALPPSF